MPVWVRADGVWKVAAPQARVDGVWNPGWWWVKVGGVWKNCSLAVPHLTTVDVGFLDTSFGLTFAQARGYSAGVIPFGSIADDTFLDTMAVERTVLFAYWQEFSSPDLNFKRYWFGLDGEGVPNTDDTFQRIEVNGVTLLRAGATYSTFGDPLPNTSWAWDLPTPPHATSGTVDFKVFFDASQS